MKPIIAVPAIGALVYRAYSKKSLTTGGLIAATLTAIAHAYHPWNMPFVLLCLFYLAGTRATHVKQEVKAGLTLRSNGASGGEGARAASQVLANSGLASLLCLLHTIQLQGRALALSDDRWPDPRGSMCYSWNGDIFVVGIIANYAVVLADTLSSELGILSTGEPRLITSLTLRKVPRGTNGGVSLTGLAAGLFGSILMVTAAVAFLPSCQPEDMDKLGGGQPWTTQQRRIFMGFLALWGLLGSLVDSFLGGWLQRTVQDTRSGKVVEGEGGKKVLISLSPEKMPGTTKTIAESSAVDDTTGTVTKRKDSKEKRPSSSGSDQPSRVTISGLDLLNNNDVNFFTATIMVAGAMLVTAAYWGTHPQTLMLP